jgi:hypothetical protein
VANQPAGRFSGSFGQSEQSIEVGREKVFFGLSLFERVDRFTERSFGDAGEVRELVMVVPIKSLREVLRDGSRGVAYLITKIEVPRGSARFRKAPYFVAEVHG